MNPACFIAGDFALTICRPRFNRAELHGRNPKPVADAVKFGARNNHQINRFFTENFVVENRPVEFQTALKNGQITEADCLNVIVRRARLIDRLLDTLRAYAHAREECEGPADSKWTTGRSARTRPIDRSFQYQAVSAGASQT